MTQKALDKLVARLATLLNRYANMGTSPARREKARDELDAVLERIVAAARECAE